MGIGMWTWNPPTPHCPMLWHSQFISSPVSAGTLSLLLSTHRDGKQSAQTCSNLLLQMRAIGHRKEIDYHVCQTELYHSSPMTPSHFPTWWTTLKVYSDHVKDWGGLVLWPLDSHTSLLGFSLFSTHTTLCFLSIKASQNQVFNVLFLIFTHERSWIRVLRRDAKEIK